MNGPDLRFLAERASGLEDRTRERLVEVHDRIAVARERRRTGAALGAAGLVVALVVGLALVQRGQDRSSPDPAPKPTTTATVGSDAAPPAPARGTCWAVPPELAARTGYWFDDSPEVPCTERHTTETVGTFQLPEPTEEEATPTGATCANMAAEYLGIDDRSIIPWGWTEYLPSKEQVGAGASWVRCDVSVPLQWALAGENPDTLRTMTTSLAGLADAPPPELWACLGKPPTEDQPLVPCDRPHAYEETGTGALVHEMTTYPSATTLATEGQQQCAADVPDRLAGASVTAQWDPEEYFNPPIPVFGACFMFNADGTLLPPR